MISDSKKVLKERLPLYAVYSLLLGFSGVLFSRFVISKTDSIDLWNVPYLSKSTVFVFIAVAVVIMALLILFLKQKAVHNSVIYNAFDSIIHSPLTFLMLCIICWRFWYYGNFNFCTVWYDTKTYVNYDHNLLLGEVDMFRTPIYPWFIKLVSFLTRTDLLDPNYYSNIAFAQMLLSLVGVAVFYFTVCKMFKNRLVRAAATLLYGISPSVGSWDLDILTESLSIFAVVVCLYLIMSYLEKPSIPLAVTLGLYTIVMVMLRPTFVYMYAILGVFFAARFILTKYDRKRALFGILSLAVSGCLLLGYCGLNKKNNDCFAISSVGTSVNQMYMVIDQEIYENTDYPDITAFIDDKLSGSYQYINYVTDIIEPAGEQFSYSYLSAYVNDCISDNKELFTEYTKEKFIGRMTENIAVQYSGMPQLTDDTFKSFDTILLNLTFPFTFADCFVMVLIAVIFSVYQLIRWRVIAWQPIGMSAIIFTHLFVSIYGSMAEYGRLSIMVVPVVYLLIFWFVDLAVSQTDKKRHNDELCSRCDMLMGETNGSIGVYSDNDEKKKSYDHSEISYEDVEDYLDDMPTDDLEEDEDMSSESAVDAQNTTENYSDTII